jgi:hypothetical protein
MNRTTTKDFFPTANKKSKAENNEGGAGDAKVDSNEKSE